MADKPACPDASAAPALAANWGALSAEEARTAASLLAAGQAHLFASWPPPGERDGDKKRLLKQARSRRSGRLVPSFLAPEEAARCACALACARALRCVAAARAARVADAAWRFALPCR